MFQLQKILHPDDVFFSQMYNLYLAAFPADERRTSDGLKKELLTGSFFSANALLLNGEFVGFMNYWAFESFFYLEHFAIDESLRGQNIGTKALSLLDNIANGLPIVFEVELPENEIARKRILFYQRNGYTLSAEPYVQPPYQAGYQAVPMAVMSSHAEFTNAHFQQIKQTLYKEVYHVDSKKKHTSR